MGNRQRKAICGRQKKGGAVTGTPIHVQWVSGGVARLYKKCANGWRDADKAYLRLMEHGEERIGGVGQGIAHKRLK